MLRALLTDLDRTLTGADLRLDKRVPARVRDLQSAGIRVALVTGRRYQDVAERGLDELFDVVVAENGAVVHSPVRGVVRRCCDPTWAARAKSALGPLDARFVWGDAVGSGPREVADEAARLLSEAKVPHVLSFNAEEVMLLPEGIDKAEGARLALELLHVDAKDAAAIGDGENDVPLLAAVGLSAVPANAAPEARAEATTVLDGEYAEGFLEFTAKLLTRSRDD